MVWYWGTARQTPLTWAASSAGGDGLAVLLLELGHDVGDVDELRLVEPREVHAHLDEVVAGLGLHLGGVLGGLLRAPAMWSILILMPVSLVKRWPISASFLSEAGAKLFQQRYEISRCWPRAGGTPVARMPARPAAGGGRRTDGESLGSWFLRWTVVGRRNGLAGHCRRTVVAVRCHTPVKSRGLWIAGRSRRRRPVLEALAQDLLVELADAGLGHGLDEDDLVGQRPPGELGAQELDDLAGLERAPRAWARRRPAGAPPTWGGARR